MNKFNSPHLSHPLSSHLTTMQKQLWVGQKVYGSVPLYNIPVTFAIQGELQVDHFRNAFQFLIDTCEVFRTIIEEKDGVPCPKVLPPFPFHLETIDLSSEQDPDHSAQSLIHSRLKNVFSLNTCLFDVALLKLSQSKWIWFHNVHHLISDGQTIELTFTRLSEFYTQSLLGTLEKRVSPLPYQTFVEWEASFMQTARFRRGTEYWKEKLQEPRDPLEIYGHQLDNRLVETHRISHALDAESSQKIRKLAESNGQNHSTASFLTFVIFTTIISAYLYRVSSNPSFSLGVPFHGRPPGPFKDMLGLFMNIAPLSVEIGPHETFESLHHKIGRELRAVTRHFRAGASYTLEKRPYNVLCNYHLSQYPPFQKMPVVTTWHHVGFANVGLAFNVQDFNIHGTFTIDIDINQEIFPESQYHRVLQHFLCFLQAFLHNPRQRVSTIPMLLPEEVTLLFPAREHPERELLVKGSSDPTLTESLCAHHLFERQAENRPECIALILGNQYLTYRYLNNRANQLAKVLQGYGVKPGFLIGIQMEKTIDLIVGILGILKAGGAYVPLDPDTPFKRLSHILEQTSLQMILTMENHLDSDLRKLPVQTVYLENIQKDLARQSTHNLNLSISPTMMAYMIFTSGSTGLPKGTAVSHHNTVSTYLGWEKEYQLCSPPMVHLQMANLAFDVFTGDLLRAVGSGGTLMLCPQETLMKPQKLYEVMRRSGVNCAEFVPAVLLHLLEYLESVSKNLSFFRLLIVGSDILHIEDFQRIRQSCGPNVRVINSYGLTETTIDSSFFEESGHLLPKTGRVPVGRSFPNTQLFVLDQTGQPAPVGVCGEIFIGGQGVSLGYWGRPDLTATRFLPNPFSQNPGQLMYRTGDLGRFSFQGELQLRGRVDDQVKIRGFRIELGEIEWVLRTNPLVKEAVVLCRGDTSEDKHLIAYVVPEHTFLTREIMIPKIKTDIQNQLPAYMVPTALILIPQLPLTSSGKINKRALPEPSLDDRLQQSNYVAPRTEREKDLCHLWEEILKLDQVGIQDNFFELGGHSLLAMQMLFRIHHTYQADISLTRFFDTPTISMITQELETDGASLNTSDIPILVRKGEKDVLTCPMSYFQQRIWFLDQLSPDTPIFNCQKCLRIDGPVNPDILQDSLREVIRRHEILRTRFEHTNQHLVQVVSKDVFFEMSVIDLTSLPPEEQSGEVQRMGQEACLRPFDLHTPPLIRVSLFQLGPNDSVLMIIMHQIVTDWWSGGILLKEISHLYSSRVSGRPSSLPPLATQVSDVTLWQQSRLAENPVIESLSFWKNQLEEPLPVLQLPCDSPRPPTLTYRGSQFPIEFSKESTAALKSLAREEGVTLYMTLLGVYFLLLFHLTRQTDIIVGSPVAIREHPAIEELIGFFINEVAIRTDLSGNPTFREVLGRVRGQTLQALEHKALPIQQVIQALQPKRRPEYSLLFQAAFVLQTAPAGTLNLPDVQSSPFPLVGRSSQLDLELDLEERSGGLVGTFTYNSDLFLPDTIKSWAGLLIELVEQVTQNPDRRLRDQSTQPESFSVPDTSIEASYPMSSIQMGMWFHHQMDSKSGTDIEQFLCRMPQNFQVPIFKSAWEQLVARIPALRTTLHGDHSSQGCQVVHRIVPPQFAEHDWRTLSVSEQQERIKKILETDRAMGFDLHRAPLWRLQFFRLEDACYDLLWTFHHGILDGRSLPLLWKELGDLYAASADHRQIRISQVPPYHHFIDWLNRQDFELAESFWKKTLRDFSEPNSFFLSKESPKDTAPVPRFSEQEVTLSPEFSEALDQLAKTQDCTLNTIAQGAWAILLSKYCGKNDVLFGAVKSGRRAPIPGVHNMIGLLINTIPVRAQVDPEKPLREWWRKLRQARKARRPFELTPLPKIQEWSALPPGTSLFESLMIVETHPLRTSLIQDHSGLPISNVRLLEQTNYPLTVAFYAEKPVRVVLNYDRTRFEDFQTDRMLNQLSRILEYMVRHPNQKVGLVPFLSQAEFTQLTEEWAQGPNYSLRPACIQDLIESQVIKTPDATAVTQGTHHLSYDSLNRYANQLAHWLRGESVGPETLVGLSFEPSLEMMITILGILKAGAAYVPLDPAYPQKRLDFIIQDAGIDIVITLQKFAPFLPQPQGVNFIYLDTINSVLAGMPQENSLSPTDPNNLAYVVYTSGTTGFPKGVAISHASLVNHAVTVRHRYSLETTDRILQFASLNFDVAAEEIFPTLIAGATLIVPSSTKGPEDFFQLIGQEQLTTANLPASYWHELINISSHWLKSIPSCLRILVVGSETVTPESLALWRSSGTEHIHWYNAYGPSEATITTTIFGPLSNQDNLGVGSVSIGRPLSNVQTYILDGTLQPISQGLVGELFIGGPGLARGYLNRPDLTARKFRPNPLTQIPGSRLFQTGDLASWLPEGRIQFHGRRDKQVKIRGYRIELKEIECLIRQFPMVKEVLLACQETEAGVKQLVAYVIGSPEPLDMSALRNYLKERLPVHMIPTAFIPLEKLPLMHNGKVDMKALPTVEEGFNNGKTYVPARTIVEKILVGIWQEIFKVENIGVHDNFFERGGHSLLATQILTRIQALFELQLPLKLLFEFPTIAQFSHQIEELLPIPFARDESKRTETK